MLIQLMRQFGQFITNELSSWGTSARLQEAKVKVHNYDPRTASYPKPDRIQEYRDRYK